MQLFLYMKANNITGKSNRNHESSSLLYARPLKKIYKEIKHTYLVMFHWLLCVFFTFLYVYFY